MKEDLTGKVFGRLTVSRAAPLRKTKGGQWKTCWECRCMCGNVVIVDRQALIRGGSRSCGCLAKELMAQRNYTHGMTRTKEYRAWAHAKGRCFDSKDPRYPIYGARGVTMCARWKDSFELFLQDMGLCPSLNLTLERKDSNGNYEPGNCRWDTRKAQANNTSENVFFEHGGVTLTLAQWAENKGIKYHSFYHFFKTKGYPFEDAIRLSTPLGVHRARGGRMY